MEYRTIPLFFTAAPFFEFKSSAQKFKFTNSIRYCLNKDSNKILIIIRHQNQLKNIEVLSKLKIKYDKLIYFDDGDSSHLFKRNYIYSFDKYFKSNTLSTLDWMRYPHKRIYEYYYDNLLGNDTKEEELSEDDLPEVYNSWDLIHGIYPMRRMINRIGIIIAHIFGAELAFNLVKSLTGMINQVGPKNSLDISNKKYIFAVFSDHTRANINYQRSEIRNLLKYDSRVITKKLKQAEYNKLLKQSRITISPFGWGEICFRDYEAIVSNSLLFKPDIGHLISSKDMFIPFETYIPFKWDFSDLRELIDYYYENTDESIRIINNAKAKFEKIRMNKNAVVNEMIVNILK